MYIWYENHKGGINNLCVAYDKKTGLTATSTISKQTAIASLNRKIKKWSVFSEKG